VTSHPIFAVLYRSTGWLGDRAGFAARRRRLLADAEGAVVEIGAGTGLSFRHYPAGIEVVATEPDPHMLKAARKAARKAKVKLTLQQAPAEALPLGDGSVDTVVSILVLCSVPDQAAALAEANRVLKPGGRLLLLEHVRAADPPWPTGRIAASADRCGSPEVAIPTGTPCARSSPRGSTPTASRR